MIFLPLCKIMLLVLLGPYLGDYYHPFCNKALKQMAFWNLPPTSRQEAFRRSKPGCNLFLSYFNFFLPGMTE